MNIVDRIARIIAPDAFVDWSSWRRIDERGERPYEPPSLTKARYDYLQSQARARASQVLAVLVRLPHDQLLAQVVDAEMEGWRELGLDVPGLREMVDRKHRGELDGQGLLQI